MSRKLYIGNLGPEATSESLKMLFSMFGKVEKAYIIPDHTTMKCQGYGFVIMTDDNEAQKAIVALNGKKVGNFTVKVEETKKKQS